MSNDNRLISLIQLDSDRAKWVEFLDAVKKKGFKEREDYFPHTSGNPSALFKASVANDAKLKDLRKKFNVTSFGLESVEASSEIKSSLYERGDKVKVLAGGSKYIPGTIVEAVFGDSHYKVQLENGTVVSRNQHEISFLSESDKIVKPNLSKKTLSESLDRIGEEDVDAEYWDQYKDGEGVVTNRGQIESAIEAAVDEWNSGAEESINGLSENEKATVYALFDQTGYMDQGIIGAIIAQGDGLSESLDKVGQEDSDINNDNVVDNTDDYLKNRRTLISRELGNMNEEDLVDEALNLYELSTDDDMSEYESAAAKHFDIPKDLFSLTVGEDGLLKVSPKDFEQFEAAYGQFMQEEMETWLNETFNALEETEEEEIFTPSLKEDHLSTKEDKIKFILSNSSDYTKEELGKLDDETIDDMYKAVEVGLTEDNDSYAETGEAESVNRFKPNYDFFGEGESEIMDRLKELNDEQIEELAELKGIEYKGKDETILSLVDFTDITKEDIEACKGKSFDDELEETLEVGMTEDEETDEVRYNADSEEYKRYDAMSSKEWNDAQYEASLEDKSLVYDSISDEYVISNEVIGSDNRPQDVEVEENFEVNEDDKQTITNIAESKGWKVKSVTGLLKESQHESLLKIIVEKKGITATVVYDDDAVIKPWSWEGKNFNFLQEALDSVYVPLKAVLKEAVSKEREEIKQKEKEVTKLLERRKEAYKTDDLSKTEKEIRAKRSQEIFNRFMDDDLLKRGF